MDPHLAHVVRARLAKGLRDSSSGSSDGGKDEEKAAVLKEQGNTHFKKRKLRQSLNSYTEVVVTHTA